MKRRPKRRYLKFIGIFLVVEIIILIIMFGGNGVVESITIEAGGELPSAIDFLNKPNAEAVYITDISLLSASVPGQYDIEIKVGLRKYKSVLEVVDTTPPKGSVKKLERNEPEEIKPEDFVTSIEDVTDVTVTYKNPPDFTQVNTQPVTLVLTDTSGNTTEYETSVRISKILESIQVEKGTEEIDMTSFLKPEVHADNLSLVEDSLQFDRVGSFPVQVNVDGILYDSVIEVVDRVPPQIYGAKKTTVYIGQPVSYKKGVYAEDDEDGEVSISVDSSQVNLKVEGEYPLYYTAVDSSGNETTVEVTVTVKQQSVTKEELEKLADEVLAEITTEDMTILEKSWAIYKYINTHLTYVGSSDKTDWMKEAHRGITRAVGDCFTYYSMSELLLNRIGIQTLSVERASMGEETNHYWHMVNYGQGWYHFDACIHIPKLVSFMLTTEELDAFSRRAGPNNYYYRYDRENYPVSEAKPTEEILALRAKN